MYIAIPAIIIAVVVVVVVAAIIMDNCSQISYFLNWIPQKKLQDVP